MKLIINIPNEVYDWHVNGFPDEEDGVRLLDIVKNGIPLPKGHGRLIDADRLKREIFIIDSYSEEPVKKQITDAPTIIEADGGEQNDIDS